MRFEAYLKALEAVYTSEWGDGLLNYAELKRMIHNAKGNLENIELQREICERVKQEISRINK